jgi:outer membrane protein assembly factor BamB
MSTPELDRRTPGSRIRMWPGVAAALLVLAARFGLPLVMPEASMFGIIGGILGALAIVVWWLFLSRAPWVDRLGALALMVVGLLATSTVVHESISTGMMGMMLPMLALPVVSVALVVSAFVTYRLSSVARRASMAAAILLTCAAFTLLRTGGISGEGESDLHWRWTPTPEERLLAQGDEPLTPLPAPVSTEAAKAEEATPPVKAHAAPLESQPRDD